MIGEYGLEWFLDFNGWSTPGYGLKESTDGNTRVHPASAEPLSHWS